MSIITISREMAALGDETAKEIAAILGYRCLDKDALEERVQSYGIEAQKFKKYDERKPSFFALLLQDRDEYMHFLRKAVLVEAEKGNCVIVGRGASLILKNLPGLVSMFLSAKREIRIDRIVKRFGHDEKRAKQIIDKSDRARGGFYRTFFGTDWRRPCNYHLSFNTGVFCPKSCAEVVASFKDRIFTPEAEIKNKTILKDMLLEHWIRHRVLYEQELPVRFFEAAICAGVITLRGTVNSRATLEAVVDCASEMAKGATIQNEMQIIR